jgi:2-keto-4-pentenoate hydratase/2-oxohepta-3-ene-1,7-dioic acid hydratase in catechol pathway
MKLIRFTVNGEEKIGTLKHDGADHITELSGTMIDALNASMDGFEKASSTNEFEKKDEFEKKRTYHLKDVKILPPVFPSKIVCVGLNYRDHAKELKMEIPDEPVIFLKPSTAVIGHLENILYPPSSSQVDYEAELAMVISREAEKVNEKNASDFIGGYTVLNDVTARDLQRKDVQWIRAKSFDSFCPLGPCIETDLDPTNQNISLRLNHQLKQNSNTKNMIFGAGELLEFISNIMTLKAGDVIATGTPPGVGPMKVGDVVEAEVEGIGVLKNYVKWINF